MVGVRDGVSDRVRVSIRTAKYGRSATYFDDPQMQTANNYKRVISGHAGH